MNEQSKDFLLGMWVAGCLGCIYVGNHTLAVVLGIVVVVLVALVGVISND